MNDEPDQTPPEPIEPERKKKSPALALSLAFLPSVMFLALLTFVLNGNPGGGLLLLACLVSAVCCFASSIMLFRRNTSLAVCAGIIFLILNAIVSFLFGCGAFLSGMKF
jgi:glucan phosphoethanolaminetransferase (alkaline phosphatase superfamily)